MTDKRALATGDQAVEAFAAELADAAYAVALRHGLGANWLTLQLELWRALTETVKQWDGNGPAPARCS
jgi:hypothetical protein